jgi:hypothetical protein
MPVHGPDLRTVSHDDLAGVPAAQHPQERVHDVLEPVDDRLVQSETAALEMRYRELVLRGRPTAS